jgi:hypothetical protein
MEMGIWMAKWAGEGSTKSGDGDESFSQNASEMGMSKGREMEMQAADAEEMTE